MNSHLEPDLHRVVLSRRLIHLVLPLGSGCLSHTLKPNKTDLPAE